MSIQWFPGHMTAAKNNAEKAMEINDVIIEVLDARIPGSSVNPIIKNIRASRQRPHLKILNKSDLADQKVTEYWLEYFNNQPKTQAITVSAKNKNDVKKIVPLCQKLAPHRNSAIKPLRIMIMGVPNVGKSTIINALHHKKIAKVGDIPAVTKSQQRIEINKETILTDTPGMMWPKISYELDGFFLAASNNIGANAYDEIETALELADVIKLRYPESILKKYGLKAPFPDDELFLDSIAKQRGFVLKKGKSNLEKAAISFINDYRQGLLGKISLETPASREKMMKKND